MIEAMKHHCKLYSCLREPERAARYCDHASPWYKAKATGHHLVAIGWVAFIGGIVAMGPEPKEDEPAVLGISLLTIALGLLVTGYTLKVIAAAPGGPVCCALWLERPAWWNRAAYAISILGGTLMTLQFLVVLGAMVVETLGAPVFFTDLGAGGHVPAPAQWAGVLLVACIITGLIYLWGAYHFETALTIARVAFTRRKAGWDWRTPWRIVQAVGAAACLGCLVTSVVQMKTTESTTVQSELLTWPNLLSLIGVVLLYAIASPFIKQVEPFYDSLCRLPRYQVAYLLTGGVLALVVALLAWGQIPAVIGASFVLAAVAAVLLVDAYLKVQHDYQYFAAVLDEGVTA